METPKQSSLTVFNEVIVKNQRTQEYLQQVLGEKRASFVNNLTSLVVNNRALQSCEPTSIMYAGIKATSLGLPLDANLGCAYVIPYNNSRNGVREAQFQIGYKGFIQLAIRSGQFKIINVTDIREGEINSIDVLSGKYVFNNIPDRHKHKVVGYAAYELLTNGFEKTLYMSVEEVEEHAKRYSKTYSSRDKDVKDSSKWATDFDAMAKKTLLKQLLSKYAPLSIEMMDAIRYDQSVIDKDSPRYVDVDVNEQLANDVEETMAKTEIDITNPTEEKRTRSKVSTDIPDKFSGE